MVTSTYYCIYFILSNICSVNSKLRRNEIDFMTEILHILNRDNQVIGQATLRA